MELVNTRRSLSCALVLSTLVGCLPGHSLPPNRTSPVLTPNGDKLELPSVLDARRDGVGVMTTAGGSEVRKLEGGAWRTLVSAPGVEITGTVSRSDTAMAFRTVSDQFIAGIHTYDGTTLADWTPRLVAVLPAKVLELFEMHASMEMSGFDLAADGSVACVVGFEAKGDEDHVWLCRLGADGVDACEVLSRTVVASSAVASADLLLEGDRTYLRADGHLFVRKGSGAFEVLSPDSVGDLRSIEGGRISYASGAGNVWTLHVLGPDGTEERHSAIAPSTTASSKGVFGHSVRGSWALGVEVGTSGDCDDGWFDWGPDQPCQVDWGQYVVSYLGDERLEVGYVNSTAQDSSGLFGGASAVPLADGGLYLEIEGRAYWLSPP